LRNHRNEKEINRKPIIQSNDTNLTILFYKRKQVEDDIEKDEEKEDNENISIKIIFLQWRNKMIN
jgi:hypothetical protein